MGPRALDDRFSGGGLLDWGHNGQCSDAAAFSSNFGGGGAFTGQMETDHASMARDTDSMDREIIRVDLPSANAGITAALRRAFQAVNETPEDRDFEALLRRLN